MIGIVVLVILVVLIGYLVSYYNRLISLKTNREGAFADIDVQLLNRFDLVDNLVNTVKGYVSHEKETLQGVTEARTHFLDAKNFDDRLDASNQLTGALKSIFAVSESYPELKANENFLQLQNELSDLENKLAASRRFFNATTKEYNTALQIFPGNIIAKYFGFEQATFFELEDQTVKQTPKVQF